MLYRTLPLTSWELARANLVRFQNRGGTDGNGSLSVATLHGFRTEEHKAGYQNERNLQGVFGFSYHDQQ